MMNFAHTNEIEMIPISSINVLNPRARNKRQHREIVNNIEAIGLKRPITVSRRISPEGTRYDLVCGEGRLEAFQILGETQIPAVVIEATESECLVMSLVENIARRTQRPIDLMKEIDALRGRGFNEVTIAQKIGVGASWVSMIISLLERGEDRLVAAVETGLIPITLAIEISKAETEEAQNLLLDAYETGQLRGKKLAAMRRLLEMRMRNQNKGTLPVSRLGRKGVSRRMTANELMQVYQREAEKQRLLVKKSDFTQTRLLFIVEALKELLTDESFVNLLRAEGLTSMPKALSARISGGMDD